MGVQIISEFHFTPHGHARFFAFAKVEQIFFYNLKYHSFSWGFLSLSLLSYSYITSLVSSFHLFVTFLFFFVMISNEIQIASNL